ncbi:MAG TPA: FHA domain-containing protein [Terriglobales bacterium]|nr:FHA domain-containing protein [Terriglobales bacterium]
MTDDKQGIKITLEDLDNVRAPEAARPAVDADPTKPKVYGTINSQPDAPAMEQEKKGSIWLKGWFYLGFAGFMGGFLAWGICEPGFVDGGGGGERWGNILLVPMVVTFICIFLSIAESIVERSLTRALKKGGLSLVLGVVLGFVFMGVANVVFNIALMIVQEMGLLAPKNPAFWVARGIAWAVFGVAGGIVYGLAGQSMKKGQYGVIGGLIGAGIGGTIFDPIALGMDGAAGSRAVGFAIFGLATGVAIGIVESAFKERWLYVASGPLAGKQFILYKPVTIIGSRQECDIYLFKDTSVSPQHAVLEARGPHVQITAMGEVYVSGSPVRTRVLQNGDLIQIGRYAFRYQERQKK